MVPKLRRSLRYRLYLLVEMRMWSCFRGVLWMVSFPVIPKVMRMCQLLDRVMYINFPLWLMEMMVSGSCFWIFFRFLGGECREYLPLSILMDWMD